MNTRVEMIRRATSVWLTALLLTLSVAVPLLERADITHGDAVESEHNPATCPPAHDHTICTQVGANFAATSHTPTVIAALDVVSIEAPLRALSAAGSPSLIGPPSRAPPLV